MKRWILISMLLFFGACSSSRWVVTEQGTIDSSQQPMVVGERNVLLLSDSADVEDPVMRFQAYDIVQKRFAERVRVERTVQKYRPKWSFLTIGVAGATFAVLAANTNTIFPSESVSRSFALNIAGGIMAAVSFSNMKPVGDPIYTGETELKRRSGYQVLADTLSTNVAEARDAVSLDISVDGESVVSREGIELNEGGIEINLATVTTEFGAEVDSTSAVRVMVSYNGSDSEYRIPITRFMEPYIRISQPVAAIRNSPSESALNLVTEVGSESTLPYIGRGPEGWHRVRFGGSEVYVSAESGSIEWMSSSEANSPTIFEFEEVPFGEIDVENSVPVLKDNVRGDRALILTSTHEGSRREYLPRDRELFRFYMRYALQMDESQIEEVNTSRSESVFQPIRNMGKMDSAGSLIAYVNGFARIDSSGAILLNTAGGYQDLASLLVESIALLEAEESLILVDLQFDPLESDTELRSSRLESAMVLQQLADSVLREHPNSAIIFSHRPDQKSSLFVKSGVENRRHHIFMYYFAEALKRRNTTVSGILRHLRNHVDYTSRRLHDRPQELQAFGNLTIDLAQ